VHALLAKKDGGVLAISVDPPELSREVVENEHLPFPILSDANRGIVKAYGLLHAGAGPRGTDVAVPAQFLLDRDGRIVWRHVSALIQDRVDPEVTLAAVQRL
jgi:peroxiredoxin